MALRNGAPSVATNCQLSRTSEIELVSVSPQFMNAQSPMMHKVATAMIRMTASKTQERIYPVVSSALCMPERSFINTKLSFLLKKHNEVFTFSFWLHL